MTLVALFDDICEPVRTLPCNAAQLSRRSEVHLGVCNMISEAFELVEGRKDSLPMANRYCGGL